MDDASGNATRPPGNIPTTGQTAQAPQVNVPIDDIYASLGRRYMRDGRAPMLGNIPMNSYRAVNAGDAVDPQDYVTLAQVQELLAAVQGVPTGRFVVASGMQVEPGYIAANGAAHSRATYPALWAYAQASGNLAASQGAKTHGQYGPGDGSTTFTVPNLYADTGYFIRPVASGRSIGSVQTDELKLHAHDATFAGNAVPGHTHDSDYATPNGSGAYIERVAKALASAQFYGTGGTGMKTAGGHTPSGSVSVQSQGGTETRPKNIAYPVLIKT